MRKVRRAKLFTLSYDCMFFVVAFVHGKNIGSVILLILKLEKQLKNKLKCFLKQNKKNYHNKHKFPFYAMLIFIVFGNCPLFRFLCLLLVFFHVLQRPKSKQLKAFLFFDCFSPSIAVKRIARVLCRSSAWKIFKQFFLQFVYIFFQCEL